jgi:alpha-tubulin suppressor-like RCC1 family protein
MAILGPGATLDMNHVLVEVCPKIGKASLFLSNPLVSHSSPLTCAFASPASRPCQVDDLTDLPTGPIKKLSSGGYVTAVLTEGNDLYVWGGRAGQPKLLEDLSDSPMSVDIEGVDVLDVAIGDNHILALSADHRLFVVGAGGNGQLGLGPDVKELGDWKEVSLPLKAGQKIVGVHAGYKNSFVLVKETTK